MCHRASVVYKMMNVLEVVNEKEKKKNEKEKKREKNCSCVDEVVVEFANEYTLLAILDYTKQRKNIRTARVNVFI